MRSLADVNLLLALLHERHVFSRSAVAWLEGRATSDPVAICRVVQMGALRILTRPSIMGDEVLTPSRFWQGWDMLMEDDRFVFVAEPSRLESAWHGITEDLQSGQCAETDCYLAAFSYAGGFCMATFDKGFRHFSGLKLELLTVK